jgi:hypothetical protein
MQLQETSLMLQTSIKVSESNINELGIELASLRRKLWECPDCTDRYLDNLGPESNEIQSDRRGAETAFAHRARPGIDYSVLVNMSIQLPHCIIGVSDKGRMQHFASAPKRKVSECRKERTDVSTTDVSHSQLHPATDA